MAAPRLPVMTAKGDIPKALPWLAIAGTGIVGGLFLGQLATGGMSNDDGEVASYAELSGNPNALAVESHAVDPCYDCADGWGYGTGVRSSYARQDRMDGEFRELGAVAIDYASEPTDDYRYGGRFDDADVAPPIVMQSPVATLPAVSEAEPSDAIEVNAPLPIKPPPPSTDPAPADSALSQ
jgi:hypothetical protein